MGILWLSYGYPMVRPCATQDTFPFPSRFFPLGGDDLSYGKIRILALNLRKKRLFCIKNTGVLAYVEKK